MYRKLQEQHLLFISIKPTTDAGNTIATRERAGFRIQNNFVFDIVTTNSFAFSSAMKKSRNATFSKIGNRGDERLIHNSDGDLLSGKCDPHNPSLFGLNNMAFFISQVDIDDTLRKFS